MKTRKNESSKAKRCPVCGESAVVSKPVRNYEYRTPMGIVTVDGVSQFTACRKCHDEFIPGELIRSWNLQILGSLARKKGALSPVELQFVFSVLPYSQNELAQAVGKDRSTLTRYKNGENPIDPLFDDILKRISTEFLAGNEDSLNRLRARTQFESTDERIKRLKIG